MKKRIWGFFCVLFLAVRLTAQVRAEETIELYATAAVLMDADTGRVLYGKNADTPMAMASTTKIMTCILVLENAEPEEVLTVSDYAAGMPKVKLYLKRGEQYTVEELLYSLMLESHNDSAAALAEHVGKKFLEKELADKPSDQYTAEESGRAVAAFARLMNEKAAELGCRDTWFITPNGLDATQEFTLKDGTVIQKEHSTTAAELARIMSYCIGESPEKEAFLEITQTAAYAFGANGRSFSCVNHNAFLTMMDGVISGKTGFTNKAGYCYVGALERDGRTFVVALLACGWPNHKTYKWSDTGKLMQYGIDNYFYRSFDEEGIAFDEGLLKPVPVINGQTEVLGETAYAGLAVVRGTGKDEGPASGGTGEEESGSRANGEKGKQESGKQAADAVEEEREEGTDEKGNTRVGSRDVAGLLLREDEEIRVEYEWEKSLTAPVKSGTAVGEIRYTVDGTIYRQDRIVTTDNVPEIRPKWCLQQVLERFLLW
ncbi:MAG: serine hydrolase [bacterium]|nr:serine hydrolase [bacterium]